MVRIVRFHRTGGPDVLQIDECPSPTPGPNEVVIKIRAFGINRAECMLRNGSYVVQPTMPCRIGFEGTGTIEATGENVTMHAVGDNVSIIPFAVADPHGYWLPVLEGHGCYGELTTVPETAVIKIPDAISPVINAAAWHQYLTAWGGLVDFGRVTSEDIVLVTASSSSAAIGGIHLCKDKGAMVIAATRSQEKLDKIQSTGADHVLLINDVHFEQEVDEITRGKGATLIYDPVAGNLTRTLISVAAPEAKIICYGNLDQDDSCLYAHDALSKRITINYYSWGDIARRPNRLREAHSYVYSRLNSGAFYPIIDTVFFGLESCVEAHKRMESNAHFGKIVIEL